MIALFLAAALSSLTPAQEVRAEALDQEIRCVRCVNEPIAQSTADIAGDMRALVRERIAAGDSDEEIREFFARRYGDAILFRPPMRPSTWLLWASPALLLLLGGALVWPSLRAKPASEPELAPEEGDR